MNPPAARILCLALVLLIITTYAVVAQSPRSRTLHKDRYSILLQAVEEGDIRTVRRLIRQGVKANPKKKGEWKSLMSGALMFAAERGHLEIIKLLLTAGADPNASAITRHGQWESPLISAMQSRGDRLKVIDTLIAGGASVNPRNGYPPILPPIYEAIGNHDVPMVKALLARGADVNAKFLNGITPLMTAVVSGRNDSIVKLLIAAGADVNMKNDFGQTALSMAQEDNDEDLVLILKQAGAKP